MVLGASCHDLNEVQFPKELRLRHVRGHVDGRPASMKCSSRRNCDLAVCMIGTRMLYRHVKKPQ